VTGLALTVVEYALDRVAVGSSVPVDQTGFGGGGGEGTVKLKEREAVPTRPVVEKVPVATYVPGERD
jgi:hypothetical protein